LGSDLVNDTYAIMININSANTSGTARNYIVDIGVDLAGGTSYTAVIDDLLAGGASSYTVSAGVWYYFPLFIPAGAAVAARARGTNATAIRVGAIFMQRPSNPSQFRKGSFVETVGANGIVGTAVTSGTTNKGSWTSLGTTTKRCWFWQLGVQVNASDTAWGAVGVHGDLAVGDGTSYDVIILDQPFLTTTGETSTNPPITVGCEWDVPAGSTLYARLQCSGTADTYGVTAYGCGG
jgi:hypothetical protein